MAAFGPALDVPGVWRSPEQLLETHLRALERRSSSGSPLEARINASRQLRSLLAHQAVRFPVSKLRRAIAVVHRALARPDEDPALIENLLWAASNLSCDSAIMAHEMTKRANFINQVAVFAGPRYGPSVQDQAVWTLSNFAADCSQCRSTVRATGVVPVLLELGLTPWLSDRRRGLVVWTLRNILRPCDGKDATPGLSSVIERTAFLRLLEIELGSRTSLRENILEALCSLREGIEDDSAMIDFVCQAHMLLHRVVHHVGHTDEQVSLAAVRVCGQIAFGEDRHVRVLLQAPLVSQFCKAFPESSTTCQTDILWTVSNIAASRDPNITRQMYHPDVLDMIAKHCYDHSDTLLREAVFCLINIATSTSGEELRDMLTSFAGFVFRDLIMIEDPTNELLVVPIQAVLRFVLDRLARGDEVMIEMAVELDLRNAVVHCAGLTYEHMRAVNTKDATANQRTLELCEELLQVLDQRLPDSCA